MKKNIDFCKILRKKAKKGSILLEIAVGISVLAILSGFIIRKTMTANRYMREQLTKSNIETITISLASFVANNKRLPRPAESTDGIESSSATNITSGYVPYKTLGISSSIAKDGNLQPFIYIVEPVLTSDYSKIYGDEFDTRTFCSDIFVPKISLQENTVQENSTTDVIAFAIDTKDHQNAIGDIVTLHPTVHTFWITRDMLLIKYLKSPPCVTENPKQNSYQHLHEFDDDF